MWDYIYFSIYLEQIDTSDHNAIESFVYNMVRRFDYTSIIGRFNFCTLWSSQIDKGNPDFFPLLVALAQDEEVEDETAHHQEELKTMFWDALDHFKAEVRVLV